MVKVYQMDEYRLGKVERILGKVSDLQDWMQADSSCKHCPHNTARNRGIVVHSYK